MSRSARQNLWASLFCVVLALIALGIGAATKAPLDTQVAPPLVGTPNDMTGMYTGTLYLPGGQVVPVRCDYTLQCRQVPK